MGNQDDAVVFGLDILYIAIVRKAEALSYFQSFAGRGKIACSVSLERVLFWKFDNTGGMLGF
jgi:hypothetical protein